MHNIFNLKHECILNLFLLTSSICVFMHRCQLLSEDYRTAKCQVKAALAALKEELSHYCSEISAGLQQAGLLQDHITHMITVACFTEVRRCKMRMGSLFLMFFCFTLEDICEPMIVSPLHNCPEAQQYLTGSVGTHLQWICFYLALLPGDV